MIAPNGDFDRDLIQIIKAEKNNKRFFPKPDVFTIHKLPPHSALFSAISKEFLIQIREV